MPTVAAEKQDAAIGIPEKEREADCGHAKVVIDEAGDKPFATWLAVNDIGYPHSEDLHCWCVHGSELHEVSTQSVSVHWAAAMEFARHLNQAGIRTIVTSYWS